jgi:hypothetical protein
MDFYKSIKKNLLINIQRDVSFKYLARNQILPCEILYQVFYINQRKEFMQHKINTKQFALDNLKNCVSPLEFNEDDTEDIDDLCGANCEVLHNLHIKLYGDSGYFIGYTREKYICGKNKEITNFLVWSVVPINDNKFRTFFSIKPNKTRDLKKIVDLELK